MLDVACSNGRRDLTSAARESAMFEIGRTYKLQMLENGREVTYHDCRVLAVEMPAVKFDHAGIRELIINVSSPAFIRAELTGNPRG